MFLICTCASFCTSHSLLLITIFTGFFCHRLLRLVEREQPANQRAPHQWLSFVDTDDAAYYFCSLFKTYIYIWTRPENCVNWNLKTRSTRNHTRYEIDNSNFWKLWKYITINKFGADVMKSIISFEFSWLSRLGGRLVALEGRGGKEGDGHWNGPQCPRHQCNFQSNCLWKSRYIMANATCSNFFMINVP